MTAAVHKGDIAFEGSVDLDGAVDFDSTVDATGATVNYRNRTVASDGALAIGGTDRTIILLASASGTKAATITAPTAHASGGPLLHIVLKAATGGAYTVACTNAATEGDVTFDAAAESATFAWVNGVLHVVTLTGATFA